MAELIDRYSRGLKSYIWDVLCLNNYDTLDSIMLEALKVEPAEQGTRRAAIPETAGTGAGAQTPMITSGGQIGNLTPEEQQSCMSKGFCLRFWERGHLAKDCPKGRGN